MNVVLVQVFPAKLFSNSWGSCDRILQQNCDGAADPIHAGFSMDTDTVNNWARSIQYTSSLRNQFTIFLSIKTLSKCKELTISCRTMHERYVDDLNRQILNLTIAPFSHEPPKLFCTGVAIAIDIVYNMLKAEIGNKHFLKFEKECLFDNNNNNNNNVFPVKEAKPVVRCGLVGINIDFLLRFNHHKRSEILPKNCPTYF